MYGLTADEWQDLVLSVNTHRGARRLGPCEVGNLIKKALRVAPAEDLAHALGFKETSTMLRLGSLSDLDTNLYQLVDWGNKSGKVPFSVAAQLVRIADRSDRSSAILAAIQYNLTKEEARQLKQSYERSSGSIDEAIAVALKSRPQVERREVILGAITDRSIENAVRTWNPGERQRRLLGVLKRHFPTVTFLAANLAPGYFSLVLDNENANRFRTMLGADSLENRITTALAEGVEQDS